MSESSSPHGRPSALAQASIQLVRAARRGVLCTLTTDGGYPYGSLVEFLSLPDGDIVLLSSSLAEHQHNMVADARVSLLIAPHIDEADALAKPRVTLVGKAGEVDAREQSAIAEAHFARHPTARSYLTLGDFRFYRIRVERARYIAGFGGMGWVSAPAYRAAAMTA